VSNPVFAWIVTGVGVLFVLISAFADPLGLGRFSCLGWRQDAWSHHRRSAHRGRALPAAPAEGCPLGAGRLPTHTLPSAERYLSSNMSPVTARSRSGLPRTGV